MRGSVLAIALSLMVAACGPSAPPLATGGPRLAAAQVAEWPTTAPPRQVAFSNDSRMLATTDASGLVTVRDTAGWKIHTRLQHPGGATAVAFSPDGQMLFTAGYDGVVRQWGLPGGKRVSELKGATGPLWTLDVSPDGSRLASAGEDHVIRIWTLAQPSVPLLLRGHDRNVWEVRFSPDGKQLASGSFDATARLWDAATGKQLRSLSGHQQAVVGLDFSPDGKMLATSGDDSTIRLWRTADGAAVRTTNVGNHTYKLDFSADGRWLVSGGRAFGNVGTLWHQLTGGGHATPIHIWRTADGGLVANLGMDDDAAHVAFSPDGQWLVTSGEDNRVRLWRLREVRA